MHHRHLQIFLFILLLLPGILAYVYYLIFLPPTSMSFPAAWLFYLGLFLLVAHPLYLVSIFLQNAIITSDNPEDISFPNNAQSQNPPISPILSRHIPTFFPFSKLPPHTIPESRIPTIRRLYKIVLWEDIVWILCTLSLLLYTYFT